MEWSRLVLTPWLKEGRWKAYKGRIKHAVEVFDWLFLFVGSVDMA